VSLRIPDNPLVLADENYRASDKKKRKAIVISSDSSDVYDLFIQNFSSLPHARVSEVLEIPPSPSKKRARNALPQPGSKEFDLFPPVSFSYGTLTCLLIFKNLTCCFVGKGWMKS
jgi:hypothetical protein